MWLTEDLAEPESKDLGCHDREYCGSDCTATKRPAEWPLQEKTDFVAVGAD